MIIITPQGSVLGRLLFAVYTSSIAAVAQLNGVQQQQYTDDTQLYITITPSDPHLNLPLLNNVWPHYNFWFYAQTVWP